MFSNAASLGIDIGNNCIRVALLYRQNRKITIHALVEENINKLFLNQALNNIKQQLKKTIGFPYRLPKNQVMTLMQSHVAIKRFTYLPNLSPHEQYMQIGMQISDSLGLPLEELLYDYYSLFEQNIIESYACRRSLLDNKFSALTHCGYELTVLELQTQSLMRLYYRQRYQFKGMGALLVDIDTERMQMLLGNRRGEPFYREIPLPASQGAISSAEYLINFTEQLAEQIVKQYQQASIQMSVTDIFEVWICGEGATQVDVSLLSKLLNWNVKLFNPLQGFHFTTSLENNLPKHSWNWATAIGSALRGVNSAEH